MRTSFTPQQLADPATAESERVLRACVHCGFCTATCPTYLLLGDELDSPRGRIYLMKEMLEQNAPATPEVVKHIDRCLSCLACMTTCPSGVHYMHLVDHARVHIERTYKRPLHERLFRSVLAHTLPYPRRVRASLRLGSMAKRVLGLRSLLPWPRRQSDAVLHEGAQSPPQHLGLLPRMRAMLDLAPVRVPPAPARHAPALFPAEGERKGRVALLSGCVQQVIGARINEATIRVLNRHGVDVVLAKGEGCCGALSHHLGREHDALAFAKRNVDAWTAEIAREELDAIVITASGCGTMIKDYGFMLRNDPEYAFKASEISARAMDISEYLARADLRWSDQTPRIAVAYHSACSLQHGQRVQRQPKELLARAGFDVRDIPEGHICCGSAGTYNILQPHLATALRERKLRNIHEVAPDVIATGNIGCIVHIGKGTATPIVHTIELIDWATGGPAPAELHSSGRTVTSVPDLPKRSGLERATLP